MVPFVVRLNMVTTNSEGQHPFRNAAESPCVLVRMLAYKRTELYQPLAIANQKARPSKVYQFALQLSSTFADHFKKCYYKHISVSMQ